MILDVKVRCVVKGDEQPRTRKVSVDASMKTAGATKRYEHEKTNNLPRHKAGYRGGGEVENIKQIPARAETRKDIHKYEL